MLPADKRTEKRPRTVQEFYDLLGPDYDAMTGFENRFVQEKPFFRLIVERYGIKKALDAGCGSGFHSMLLSQLGVQVTAVDASAEMVRLTEKHAREYKVDIQTLKGSFGDLEWLVRGKFDAVFVMGNSLAHFRDKSELKKSLLSFSRLLDEGGIFFTQNLNYERILATRDRIQSSKESGDKTFIRYYDYDGDNVFFNLLTQEKTAGGISEKLESIRLRPILRKELVALLSGTGFTDVQVFGGISMESFDSESSKDLVVLAKKAK